MNDAFWDYLCGALPAIVALRALNVGLLLMLGFAWFFVTPGTAAYYVGLMGGALAVASVVGSTLVIRVCESH